MASTAATGFDRTTSLLLWAAFAVAVLYYGTLLVASQLYPGEPRPAEDSCGYSACTRFSFALIPQYPKLAA